VPLFGAWAAWREPISKPSDPALVRARARSAESPECDVGAWHVGGEVAYDSPRPSSRLVIATDPSPVDPRADEGLLSQLLSDLQVPGEREAEPTSFGRVSAKNSS